MRRKSSTSEARRTGPEPELGGNDPLDQRVLGHRRLRRGIRSEEARALLEQISISRAADLQEAMPEEEWAERTELSQRLWDVALMPLLVRPVIKKTRADVVARFAALLDLEIRPGDFAYWFVSGYLSRIGTELAVAELTLEPEQPDSKVPLTPALLRGISLPQILARAQAQLQLAPEWVDLADRLAPTRPDERSRRDAEEAAGIAASVGRRKGGRPSHPDALYALVAREYLTLYDSGLTRGIRKQLASILSEKLDRPVPEPTVRDWIRGARERGFLTPATPGRAGARPGPNLRA